MVHIDYKRRQFLQYAALGTITATLPGFALAESRKINVTPDTAFKADVEIALTAQTADVPILPGAYTHVFKYYGKLLKGPQAALRELPGYLGPILNFEQGQKVEYIFITSCRSRVLPIGTVCMYRRKWMGIPCMRYTG